MRRVTDVALSIAAAAVVAAASGILIPAPTRGLLPVSVAAPELCALLMTASVVVALVALRRPRTRVRLAAAAAAVCAAAVSATPMVGFPAVAASADAALGAALGSDYLSRIPLSVRAGLQPRAVSAWELFAGPRSPAVRETRGVVFGAPEGQPLTVDVYQPASGGGPSIVQVYGGSWQRGAPGDDPVLARHLASHGYVVFAVDYRHAPRWRWPAQQEDIRRALLWVHDHAQSYGGDAGRIALLGRSAGAHVALMGAYTSGVPGLTAVVSLYGPTDLVRGYEEVPRPDPIDVRSKLEALMGGPPGDMIERYRAASPVSYAGTRQPATLQIVGSQDHVVLPRFPRELDERLRAAGNVSVLVEIPWADHAFDAVPFGPSAQIARYTIERFLASTLRTGQSAVRTAPPVPPFLRPSVLIDAGRTPRRPISAAGRSPSDGRTGRPRARGATRSRSSRPRSAGRPPPPRGRTSHPDPEPSESSGPCRHSRSRD